MHVSNFKELLKRVKRQPSSAR